MGVVKAKIQTVEDIYRLVWTAVASKQPMRAIYKEHPRLFCPHRLPQPLNVRSNSPMLNAAACTSTRLNTLSWPRTYGLEPGSLLAELFESMRHR